MLLLGGTNYIVDVGGGGLKEYSNKLEFHFTASNSTLKHNLKGKQIYLVLTWNVRSNSRRGESCYFDGMLFGEATGSGVSGVFRVEYTPSSDTFTQRYIIWTNNPNDYGGPVEVDLRGEVYYN